MLYQRIISSLNFIIASAKTQWFTIRISFLDQHVYWISSDWKMGIATWSSEPSCFRIPLITKRCLGNEVRALVSHFYCYELNWIWFGKYCLFFFVYVVILYEIGLRMHWRLATFLKTIKKVYGVMFFDM